MQVRVRYFAMLREARGVDEESVPVRPGMTVGQLYTDLFPPGPHGRLPVLFAVDHEYVQHDHVLADGAEVAFIPPVGGG